MSEGRSIAARTNEEERARLGCLALILTNNEDEQSVNLLSSELCFISFSHTLFKLRTNGGFGE